MDISVVIATRNRPESLGRLITCLSLQSYPLAEVIIVDSSDQPIEQAALDKFNLRCRVLPSQPSVCAQRNLGVRQSQYDWILLCDDDIEMPTDYVIQLAAFAEENQHATAISGLFLELDGDNRWISEHPPSSMGLLWHFIFQLPVWADLNRVSFNRTANALLKPVKRFYLRRGNTFTLAGWPLLVDFRSPVFQTSVYSLGASLIKKDCLVRSPYDERLDSNGIGDNYGVALNMAQEKPIHVLTSTFVQHHKSPTNRPEYQIVYARRVLALHYLMKQSHRFGPMNIVFLLWSLIGNFLRQVLFGEFAVASVTARVFAMIAFGNNPYLRVPRRRQ